MDFPMALTPTQRPTREWPLLILTLALVGIVVIPLSQGVFGDESASGGWGHWDAPRWGRLLLGPAQFASYVCFLWAGFILLSRFLELRRQRKAFRFGLLPTEEGARILIEDARPLQRKIDQVTSRHGPFILANMIRLALGKFGTSRTGHAVIETVRTQADVEQGRLSTNMATVHYLAWALPAIGFLGTVVGLAGSMSMAPHMNEDTFLAQATGHLTFAFDCTLVALSLSLVLMFLVHSIQRLEEALVIDCQQFCLEHLVNRTYEPEALPEEPAAVPYPTREHAPPPSAPVSRAERVSR
jgi:biopolymer transport protein ExbB/TolQ